MTFEAMTNDELMVLIRLPEVEGLTEDILHRVRWAIMQAIAANALEARVAELEGEADRLRELRCDKGNCARRTLRVQARVRKAAANGEGGEDG